MRVKVRVRTLRLFELCCLVVLFCASTQKEKNMVEVTGIIGTTTAVTTARTPVPSSYASGAQTELQTTQQVKPLSPAMRFDPVAGVMITEYLNSSGEIESQLPSAASVAYLRVGLTPTGQQPEKAEAKTQTEKTV